MTAIHFMVDWQRHRETQIQIQTQTETHRILHTQCCLKCACVCVCGCVCNVAYSCWFLRPHSQCNRALIDTVNDMHIMCSCVCVCVYRKRKWQAELHAHWSCILCAAVCCVCLQVLLVAACLMTNLMCFACWNVLFQLQQQVMQLIEAHTHTQIYIYIYSYITHTIQHR